MSESKSKVKSFDISKWVVKETYQRVRANKGAAGVDGVTIERYEQDLEKNLYKLWNRMSRKRRDKPAWEEEMEELYAEGLATHGDPE